MPRPVVHGRDHEHGGADPARILYESVGSGGGGGGYTPVYAYGRADGDGGGALYANNAALLLNTSGSLSPDLVNVTISSDKKWFVVGVAGMYAIHGVADMGFTPPWADGRTLGLIIQWSNSSGSTGGSLAVSKSSHGYANSGSGVVEIQSVSTFATRSLGVGDEVGLQAHSGLGVGDGWASGGTGTVGVGAYSLLIHRLDP